MRNFENVLVIYPVDSTIDFLQPAFDRITTLFSGCKISRPQFGEYLHSIIDDETNLVLFLGHGTPSGLYSGANEKGEKQLLCDIQQGALLLNECAVVLFSCNSNDLLCKLQRNSAQIINYVVFGDMPTDKEHVKHNQELYNTYWTEFNEEQLNFYIKTLVEFVIYGFEKGYRTNSFYGFIKGANRIINLKINDIIYSENWTKNQKLQLIERLIEVKTDIKYSDSILN